MKSSHDNTTTIKIMPSLLPNTSQKSALEKLAQEAEDLKQKLNSLNLRSLFDLLGTNAELNNEFSLAGEEYNRIKKAVINTNLLSKEQIENIESHAQNAAEIFYPELQEIFDKRKSIITAENHKKIDKQQIKLDEISDAYDQRNAEYHKPRPQQSSIKFLFSLPFILGNIIVHALDKLIFALRASALEHSITKLKKRNIDQIYKEEKSIAKSINEPVSQFKQSFFNLSKTAQQNEKMKQAIITPEDDSQTVTISEQPKVFAP